MRHARLLALLLPLHLVALPAAAQPARPAADSGAAGDEADAFFQKAKAALTSGNSPQAYELYLSAWKLKQTHDIAGNLAQVELMLGKKRDAAGHIAFALAHFPPSVQSERREALRKVLDGLRKDLGVLRIRVSVADARVAVDGTPIGPAPLPGEVFVDPGAHVVEASLPGYKLAQARVDAPKGASLDVALDLVKEGEPPPVKRSVVPGAVLGGVAGAALIAGIGVFAAGRAKGASGGNERDAILQAGNSCVAGAANYDARCSDVSSTASTANTFQKVGVGLMVGAGVAAVGSVIYFVVPTSSAGARTGGLRLSPSLSPTGGALALSGAW